MRIHGAGCCLIDSIYMHCSYESEAFTALWSKERGDGGLIEGGLVFTEDLEKFASTSHHQIINSLSGGRQADGKNLGGPAVVSLVHAAQILADKHVEVCFYGAVGNDSNADLVRNTISKTPLHAVLKSVEGMSTPTTEVFDDPSMRKGKGERSFINTIGAAHAFSSQDLPPSFYDADIILLGGTALVPGLHDEMHEVLKKAKENNCITVVGTVYDFRNEKESNTGRWPLGIQPSYPYIDVLVSDEEESLRLTGTNSVEGAARALIEFGVGAFIITRGALPMLVWSRGTLIEKTSQKTMPVSAYMDTLMEKDPSLRKDTTGCGDNFLGGVLVSIAQQMGKAELISMVDICAWGAASGGFACTYHGGTYLEKESGDKKKHLLPVVQAYLGAVRSERCV
ncbi:carbohydrate kinase family protein [Sphaerochaeta globosa]|uniref:PfkB domain protein n=1 Tax=Sphaerochaeta globosa (strain ATCC BAA-1886 / DSM 22777 / Buddy) TaxID=158189 RepID=F0RU79_SPHGB|nr:carbohydrate kinase family protein [Sphaerochaeta globosa]ADY12165.1 PfkB domain protein [Sphaerochaeta globosa str. Buddy]